MLCHPMSGRTVSKRRPNAPETVLDAIRTAGPAGVRGSVAHVEYVDRPSGGTGFSQHRHALARHNEAISERQQSQKWILVGVWLPSEEKVPPSERLA